MTKRIFITATDTDAGKTYVATLLIKALVAEGLKIAVYKPISAGCEIISGQLINDDAAQLLRASNCQQNINQVNPIAFKEAIAPHIAAQINNKSIALDEVINGYDKILALNADVIVCEGAGGWRLPLGNNQFLSTFVKTTKQEVILVVNMKLGCLNHAILTYESIVADGLNCIGWIANCPETMPYLKENINELENLLPIAKLAELAFEEQADVSIAGKISLATILS